MERRHELHDQLVDILGSKNVYFQPPASVHLEYPCILYRRSNAATRFSDNKPYNFIKQYEITYITKNPDDPMVDKLAMAFQMIEHDRFYTADNLNHDVFTLYF